MTGFLYEVLQATWWMTIQAAPFILFGLLVAGLIHVLLPESLVLRWMGRPGISGVVRAALIGVPLPVCSCGVVPITVELRRKGASKPAAQSFLITTPESSIDSIFLTWGLMGPVMAIARPIAAFFTAVLGGALSIASAKSIDELTGPDSSAGHDHDHHHHDHDHHHHDHDHHHHGHDHSHDHDHHDHDHHHHHHHGHDHHDHDHDLAYSGNETARQVLRDVFLAKGDDRKDLGRRLWDDVLRPAFRYGFSDLLDDLAFWLVIGLGVAGVLAAALPDNLGELGLGSGLLPMIVLLVAGIPMYMCASASTPIAAALLAKGVSPGAALVFMLAGPATNAATVLLLMGTFGRRFVKVYLFSVVVGALAAGLLLDAVMGGVMPDLSLIDGGETAPGLWSVLLSLLLAVLLVRSLTGGAWLAGMAELRAARQRMANELPVLRRVSKRGVTLAVAILAIVGYLATGIRVVPPESKGYGFLFGELYRADLGPGLHYVPPAPFGWWEVRWASYPRKSDIGFATDLEMLERRRDLARMAPRGDWHSPVAAMNPRPAQATFLTADENLVEMSFSVHYSLSDASKFFYGVDHREDFVNLYAESVARELVATAILDDLLTELRPDIETQIATALQAELDKASLGVDIRSIQIVDLHPPGDAVHAFRDVSSALEDRETAIHRSHGRVAQSVPRARGNAMGVVADAEAAAEKSRLEASGRSSSFTALVEPYGRHPDLLGHLLWLETAERVLAGREKYIVPSDVSAPGVTLWRDRTPPIPIFTHEDP